MRARAAHEDVNAWPRVYLPAKFTYLPSSANEGTSMKERQVIEFTEGDTSDPRYSQPAAQTTRRDAELSVERIETQAETQTRVKREYVVVHAQGHPQHLAGSQHATLRAIGSFFCQRHVELG